MDKIDTSYLDKWKKLEFPDKQIWVIYFDHNRNYLKGRDINIWNNRFHLSKENIEIFSNAELGECFYYDSNTYIVIKAKGKYI